MTCSGTTLSLPLIVMPREAGPLIVRRLSVTAGNVLSSEIVPVTRGEKLIVSLPLPAAQPFVAVIVFAAVIASRRTQRRGAPVSANESTVIVAARASQRASS